MNPNSLELAAWVGCLFFLVAGWNQVEKFFDRRLQRGPQRGAPPATVALSRLEPPVSDALCQSRRQELDHELARLDQELGGLRRERRAEVAGLQQQINKVDREVGELRAAMELSRQQLSRIDAKLDRVIERHTP